MLILYQLAKWLEAREQLHIRMREKNVNNTPLAVQKRKMEKDILRLANDWKIETANEWFRHD